MSESVAGFYFRRKTAQLDFRRAKPLRQLFWFGPRTKDQCATAR